MAAEERILLADDDDVGRYVIATMLRRAGFAVDEVADGGAAVEAIRAHPPDLAVLDVKMPHLTGFEACRAVKGDERTRHVPVLLLSATFMDDQARVEGLEGGADSYLTQPVEAPVLAATVRSLIRSRRLEQAVNDAARQWRATFDAIADAVALVDAGGRVRRVNRSFLELLGDGHTDVIGRPVDELVPELVPGVVLAADVPDPFDVELGGRVLRTRVDVVPALDDAGGTERVVTLSDVTALRAVERERATALSREREISRTLQESLLPEHLPRVSHVALDAWHVAAEHELIVGGDWYDAIETDRHLWLVIGDVAGHGVRATAQAGQLRHTLRGYAHEGLTADAAMVAINDLVISQRGFATVLIAAIDPEARELRIVCAGHPPLLLLGADGCELLGEGSGPALGVPNDGYVVHTRAIGPGDRLLIYTDGLVERPREHLDVGFDRLCTVAERTTGIGELRDELVGQLVSRTELRDDVALLMAEIS